MYSQTPFCPRVLGGDGLGDDAPVPQDAEEILQPGTMAAGAGGKIIDEQASSHGVSQRMVLACEATQSPSHQADKPA